MAPAIYLRAIPWTLSSRFVLVLFFTALIRTIEQYARVGLIIAVYIQWHNFGERPHVGPMALLLTNIMFSIKEPIHICFKAEVIFICRTYM